MKKLSALCVFLYFNQVSRRKDLKRRYFALISLKTDSLFNFTLKDMHGTRITSVLFLLIYRHECFNHSVNKVKI